MRLRLHQHIVLQKVVETKINHIFLFHLPLITMHLTGIIGLMFSCFFFYSDRHVVSVLTRVAEFPSEGTNEYTSLSMYDVTFAQHPGIKAWHETTKKRPHLNKSSKLNEKIQIF